MSTKIEWVRNADGGRGSTWNVVRGCWRTSAGCDHCYAMRMARRMDAPGGAYEGLTRMTDRGVDWSGKVRFISEKLGDPLKWRKPRTVFVNSMSDLFHAQVTDEQIAAVFGVMAACPQHLFQILTKRPRRMAKWFRRLADCQNCGAWTECHAAALALDDSADTIHSRSGGAPDRPWPLPNVTLGVSCEGPNVLYRLDTLRGVPALMRLVSFEPLLAPIAPDLTGIGLVIAGCESGPGARPTETDWFRSLRDQCIEAGVPYFLKQMVVDGKLTKMPELDGRVWDQLPKETR